MAYILKKGNYYCFINDRNKVCKTQDIELATKFSNTGKAYAQLKRATKKLSGYKVIDLETDLETEESIKTKRKQFSRTVKTAIYNKNKGRCSICGKFVPYDEFTVDHIIPLSKGGTNELNNLQCTCKKCNVIKQDILPDELMGKLTDIVLYQMKIHYNELFWKKINYIRKRKQKVKILKVINVLIKRY